MITIPDPGLLVARGLIAKFNSSQRVDAAGFRQKHVSTTTSIYTLHFRHSSFSPVLTCYGLTGRGDLTWPQLLLRLIHRCQSASSIAILCLPPVHPTPSKAICLLQITINFWCKTSPFQSFIYVSAYYNVPSFTQNLTLETNKVSPFFCGLIVGVENTQCDSILQRSSKKKKDIVHFR